MTTTVNLLPTGDGALTDWTAIGEATRWECVDDPVSTPNEETDFIYANASVTAKSNCFVIGDTTTTGQINNITIHVRTKTSSVLGATILVPFLRIGGVNYNGPLINPSNDFANYTMAWNTNPATSAIWTNTDVNSLEIGISLVPTGYQNYLTQIYLSVTYSVGHQINGGTYIPGVSANWQRRAKRTNDDGSVDWQDYATLIWDISQATMAVYEELRAAQGRVLTSLLTTDIDNRNVAKLYSYAEIVSVVPVQQIGQRGTGLRVEFMVKI